MHPNKFRCAWLGQGGALKVVSKGFEGAMMLGAKKIDRSKISVLPKTAKKLGFLSSFEFVDFCAEFIDCDRAT